ncbi:hypothetical protein GBA52_009842 [Prunus armeniaca]|nr:hypothetical protein GBA52_009842 [Prunus armeniaca]
MKNNLQQWQQPNSFSLSSSSQFSFPISSALTTQTLVNASEILSDFGYTSMALTLDLASQTLLSSQSHSFTIFAPTEDPFSHSGQPPLNLLQFHIIPFYFSLRSLKSLPYDAKISTLLFDLSLSVTTLAYNPIVSLNNVPIIVSPIFDHGLLIIF